jgi:hypothetical protein
MDRTSSSHNLRTTDTSQDNSINNKQTQSKKPSGIISIKYQSNTLSLTSTKRLTSTEHPKRAPNTNVSINYKILGDEKTNPYKDGKFADIQEETRDAYNAHISFEDSVTNYHIEYDSIKNDPTKIEQWKEFKSARDTLPSNGNLQNLDKYKNLHKRSTPSRLEKLLASSPLSTKLDPLTGVLRDSKTGLYVELKPLGSKPGNYALCFGSTRNGRMTLKQIKVDIAQVLNQEKVPAAYLQAVDLAAELIKELSKSGANITVTGQSMGGGIANFVGLRLGIHSVCFNPAALGQAAIKYLEKLGCLTAENLNKQKIIRQKGDVFSGEKNQKKIAILANFFSFIKIKRPQHLGKIYIADKADMDATNEPKRGSGLRHKTIAFGPFYKHNFKDTQTTQATTPSDNADKSSESSSASSPSGGEKS